LTVVAKAPPNIGTPSKVPARLSHVSSIENDSHSIDVGDLTYFTFYLALDYGY